MSSSQPRDQHPIPLSQRSEADLTPAQKRRRLAVQQYALASASSSAAPTPSTSASPPPTPNAAGLSEAEREAQAALEEKLAKLSSSQLSLYKAGLYQLPVQPVPPPPTPAAAATVQPEPEPTPPPPPPPPWTEVKGKGVNEIKVERPRITPAEQSHAWFSEGGSSSQPIELDSSPPSSPATLPASPPRAVGPPAGKVKRELRDGEKCDGKESKAEARKRARVKRARGGFDTDSSEDEGRGPGGMLAGVKVEGVDAKPSIPAQGRTQRALPSRPPAEPSAPATPDLGPDIPLSDEQEHVRSLVVDKGLSVFFTGSAGTGKSVLLRALIRSLRRKHPATSIAVTASTGIAACNLAGSTVHSFAGIGLGLEDLRRLASKCRGRKEVLKRWKETKVWIIDELSMLDGELFDKLSQLGSILRNDDRPFGGIQMVVCGDFLQLPPVTSGGREPKFCFEARCWPKVVKRAINLTEVFRQKDQTFVDMLNELRFGRLSPRTIEVFSSMSRAVKYADGLEPTELFSHRAQVETANLVRLRALGTEDKTYDAVDWGKLGPEARLKVLNNSMAPQTLSLKVGAQVMLIKNKSTSLVNGSIGTVLAFTDRRTYLDAVYGPMSLAPADELAGMGTARRQALGDLVEEAWWGEEDEDDGAGKLQEGGERFPLVRFSVPGGKSVEVLVEREDFKVETPDGEVAACRRQVPLILAWAMSIHKSQGQTLQRMKCDLGKVFEKGQAYVALSRATSLETLQILNFRADKVMSHPRVAEWNSRNLETLKLGPKVPKPKAAAAAKHESIEAKQEESL